MRARELVEREREHRPRGRAGLDDASTRRRRPCRSFAAGTRSPSRRRASASPLTTKPPGPSPNRAAVSERRGRRRPSPRTRRGERDRLPESPRSSSTSAPIAPARQHSASATASPPSAMSWALESVPARTASRTAICAARTASMSISGSPSGSGWPSSLASSLGRQRRAERPDERDVIAGALEAQPPGAARVGQPADHADHGRRVDRAGGALVVQGHVAADDRRLAARGRRRRGRAPTRSAARRCAAFSGLPKLRLLVVPSGSAPTHARLAAHSSTAATVPV